MKRSNNFDLLRIFATVAVIFIHVNAIFFVDRSTSIDIKSAEYIVESLINIATRYSVPVFVMISGAFILNNPNNSNAKLFYKKVGYKIGLYFLLAMITVLLIDEIIIVINHGNIFIPLIQILAGLYSNYWYMFMLMGIYILTPFVLMIKENISDKTYLYLSVILSVWSCGSQAVSSYRISYAIGVVFAYLSYFIMGDILCNYINRKIKLLHVCCIFLILITFIIRCTGFSLYLFDPFTNFFSPTIILYSYCVFLIFKYWKFSLDIQNISKYMLGVYLFHTFILNLLKNTLIQASIKYGEIVSIIIGGIIVFIISLICAIIFDKMWAFFSDNCGLGSKWNSLRIWKDN